MSSAYTRSLNVSVSKVIKERLFDEKLIDQAIKNASKELAERGLQTANNILKDVEYHGYNDVKVEVVNEDGNYALRFSGEALPFIEYGTGIHFGQKYPGNVQMRGIPIGPGTYGKGLGAGYATTRAKGDVGANIDYWYFPAENDTTWGGKYGGHSTKHPKMNWTYGNEPYAVIYKTREAMMDLAKEIFKENIDSALHSPKLRTHKYSASYIPAL